MISISSFTRGAGLLTSNRDTCAIAGTLHTTATKNADSFMLNR